MTPERPTGPGAGACPDPTMLSAYLDGKLDAAERNRVEEHISRCEDCYFVVKETALVWRQEEGSGVAEDPAPVSPGASRSERGRQSTFLRGFLLPLAATLVVAAGSLALWRQLQTADSYAESVRPLVEAVGERRFVEPRLTGGFRFGPLRGARRGAEPSEAERWSVLASAGEIKARTDKSPTPANRRALAAAEIMIDEPDGAIGRLEQLAREFPIDASVQSDLAAAYIARALRTGHEDDWRRALGAADTATRLDPALIEARYNRALVIEATSSGAEAQTAWRGYLDAAGGAADGWAGEARRRLEALAPRPSTNPVPPR